MTKKSGDRAAAGGPTLVVKQVRSGIGFDVRQKRTLKALGLGKMGRERTLPDNEAVRGMIGSISHLVQIVEPKDQRSGS